MEIQDVIALLNERALSPGLPPATRTDAPRPTPERVAEAEEKLGTSFPADYRQYLLEASHLVCGPFEPAVLDAPDPRLDLVTIAERAWNDGGLPRELLPICAHGERFYCLDGDGKVVLWPAGTGLEEPLEWPDLASWISETWIESLVEPTGDHRLDEILRGVVSLFEMAFPGRISGYYLEGSQSDGRAVAQSDIDLRVLFETVPDLLETRRAARLREAARQLCPLLEVRLGSVDVALKVGNYSLKVRSRPLFGADVREQIPMISVEQYVDLVVHPAYYFLTDLRGRPEAVPHPFTHPDPDDEFFGYVKPIERTLDGVPRDGIKEFISAMGWAARAMAALRAKQHLSARNSDCPLLYKEWVGDDWTPFLEELFERGRGEWHYLVPSDPAARQRLRELCEQAVGFENHFLETYRQYLLFLLGMPMDRAKLYALKRLAALRYQDDQVRGAIAALAEGEADNDQVKNAATRVLALYQD